MRRSHGFTLVELLVVIAIIGILIAIVIPAVQAVRGSARNAACKNNLHQIGLALHNYHSARQSFPYGSTENAEHSWNSEILPFMEMNQVYLDMDFTVAWNDPRNQLAAESAVPNFICPAGNLEFAGQTDYAGIMGSLLSGLPGGTGANEAFGSGMLIRLSKKQRSPTRLERVIDGTSQTLLVAEVVDRPAESAGMWADGNNLISHDNGPINHRQSTGEIQSWHPAGANALFADGSVAFLHRTIDLQTLGAIQTRNGGESFERTW